MKQCLLFIGLLSILLSCSDNDAELYSKDSPFKLSTDNSVSPKGWTSDAQIGIFMLQPDTQLSNSTIVENVNNVSFVTKSPIDGNEASINFIPSTGIVSYPQDNSSVDLIAYYPYTLNITDYKLPINVEDQENQNAIDILYSNNAKAMNWSNSNTQLTFKHVLSKLKFKITAGANLTDAQLAGLNIKINNIINEAELDLSTADIQTKITPSVLNIKMDDNGLGGEAIIIPQVLTSSQLIFTINSEEYIWDGVEANLSFVGGAEYLFDITINKQTTRSFEKPLDIQTKISLIKTI